MFILTVETGYITTILTTIESLSAEKRVQFLLEMGWNMLGIPTIIYSDQGPQFAGSWFRTLCARLGVRQAFSQARRPQGNGRVEVAGKCVKDMLRKLHASEGINCVEALPRAVKLYNIALM